MSRRDWITLYPCLMRRHLLAPATPDQDAPLITTTINDVRLGSCKIDLEGFALALAATGLCPSIEEARERIAARILAEREDVELEIGELLKQRVLGRKPGRPADPVLIDDHIGRYVWKWYPRALDLADTVRALVPFVCATDPDDADPQYIDHAAVMWAHLTIPSSTTYEGLGRRLTLYDNDGRQIHTRAVLQTGEILTDAAVIQGRERTLLETTQTAHGPLWRYWLRGLPTRLLDVNKLAERLTAADEACSIEEIMKAIAARQDYVDAETEKLRADHDARHTHTLRYARAAHAKHVRRDARGGPDAIKHRWRERAEARARG